MKLVSVYFHGLDDKQVIAGKIAYKNGLAKFEYDSHFLRTNLNLSPFSIDFRNGLQDAKPSPFNGLHGLFADSLPDGWGMLIMDRSLIKHGINPQNVNPIDRLAYVGSRAMGALSYQPDEGEKFFGSKEKININTIAEESIKIYTGEVDDVLSEIEENSISPAGARPKSLIAMSSFGTSVISGTQDIPDNYEHWLVKFPPGKNSYAKAEGIIEFIYSTMARKAGIDFPKTKLIKAKDNSYFLTKRFDRTKNNQRVHVHSLAGLVHADFRVCDFSYDNLLKVCQRMTLSQAEVIQLFRRMIFNIVVGNRDDHSKNFSFIMNARGVWRNSPAYDVTYSKGMGEHAMLIGNKGKDITLTDLHNIGKLFSINKKIVNSLLEQILDSLFIWFEESKNHSIPKPLIDEITAYMNKQKKLWVR